MDEPMIWTYREAQEEIIKLRAELKAIINLIAIDDRVIEALNVELKAAGMLFCWM